MTDVVHVHEDEYVEMMERAEMALKTAEFPRLEVEEITDDGETYMALRCPRCGGSISEGGELFAVGIGWTEESEEPLGDFEFDHEIMPFGQPDRPDTETLYYRHGDNPGHAVSLPEGWAESWR